MPLRKINLPKSDELTAKTLGGRIKEVRDEKKINQEDLAVLLRKHRPDLSEIENDKVDIRFSTLKKIAKALDVKLTRLIRGLEDM